MKVLVFVLAFAATGCATSPYTRLTDKVVDNGMSRFDDKARSVSCYVYRDGDGSSVSCVRVEQ